MKKWYETTGSVLLLFTLFLPVFLLVTGLAIDGGLLMAQKASLQTIADAASSAGASQIGDLIVDIVREKKWNNPELVIPRDITELLTEEDIEALRNAPEVLETVREYLDKNNTKHMSLDGLSLEYPYRYDETKRNLTIYISWTLPVQLYFAPMIGKNTASVSISSLASLAV